MGRLTNKVAVITGGNSGMGLETAKRFAAEGAKVVITGRRQNTVDEAVKAIGGTAIGVQGDISNLTDLNRLYETVKQKFGHIDILFANAGVAPLSPLGFVTEEHFDSIFNTNVKGLLFTIQKALPLLKDGSSIILNASVAHMKGLGAMSVYSASKAAVRSFARGWSVELKERKIRVNVISPGPIETPIFGKMGMSEEEMKGFGAMVIPQIPLGRMGQSTEIANAALFLASDESSFITGIDLCVDGGLAQV
jgi:NAD(P)-dependent dehydrogenase (short-subunit alcohol dehydrogenase family)